MVASDAIPRGSSTHKPCDRRSGTATSPDAGHASSIRTRGPADRSYVHHSPGRGETRAGRSPHAGVCPSRLDYRAQLGGPVRHLFSNLAFDRPAADRLPTCCENFLYVFKAARNGPHAPPIGRPVAAAAVARRRPGRRPSAGADSEMPAGPPRNGQRRGHMIEVGRQPAGRASWTRSVTGTPRRSGVRTAVGVASGGGLQLRDGRNLCGRRRGWMVARSGWA